MRLATLAIGNGPTTSRRSGKILVMLVLLLALLLGTTGLVIDGGMLMATDRQVHNSADGAALAAAMHLFRGDSVGGATTAANAFVQSYNGLPGAPAPTVNIPPASGPYAGDPQYAEVIVRYPVTTRLVQWLGVNSSQTVRARAVAGFEAVGSGEGAIVLDPGVYLDPILNPGLRVRGGGTLLVGGAVVVNSRGSGLDQYGQWYASGWPPYAAQATNNSTVRARFIQVCGGVGDFVDNFQNIDPAGPNPLFARARMTSDPLRNLPVPIVSTDGVVTDGDGYPPPARNPPLPAGLHVVTNGETRIFRPGLYKHIEIKNGAAVTFEPGIYVIAPDATFSGHPEVGMPLGLRVTGTVAITANGVLFYATGSNYPQAVNGISPGYYDVLDGHLDGPLPPTNGSNILPNPPDPSFSGVVFAKVELKPAGGSFILTGIGNSNSVYHRISFFRRRRPSAQSAANDAANQNIITIEAAAGPNINLGGTMYAKWVRFDLAGGGRYDAQFVVGTLDVSGSATLTIIGTGKNWGRANQVFLVE